ncbi:hypothetical protein BTUL_0025g00130 [Botrytis tulipae]|uniref:Uncharacterized protein n=1 Tax=Botrytis tulipae TaxID=87230 RepID=A0A4Z1EZB8_9HELO|nr:hypothetical protein BTUL_0025g00130 [Botrytis tulipae]
MVGIVSQIDLDLANTSSTELYKGTAFSLVGYRRQSYILASGTATSKIEKGMAARLLGFIIIEEFEL